ncbi:hypothetical protein [Megalodesulfovibrio gigas]|uniref:hypothetical protein n=1 Tax=Megalodesulfovibrio gigas TaxID=879 RepID=UPI0012B65063|nr:hypothetical protein [Megalodesulfovibrio gigas]
MDLVHRLLALHFTGKQDKYGSLKAWPAPDLPSGKAWNPPVKGLVPRTIAP